MLITPKEKENKTSVLKIKLGYSRKLVYGIFCFELDAILRIINYLLEIIKWFRSVMSTHIKNESARPATHCDSNFRTTCLSF